MTQIPTRLSLVAPLSIAARAIPGTTPLNWLGIAIIVVMSGCDFQSTRPASISQKVNAVDSTDGSTSSKRSQSRKAPISALDRALAKSGGDWKQAAKEVGAQCEIDSKGRLVEFSWGSYPEVNDAEIRTISRETSLKSLRLSSAGGVTDVGLGDLQKLTELETLSIYFDTISDLGVLQLASLKKLKKLAIDGAHISEEARAVLREELPNCEIP